MSEDIDRVAREGLDAPKHYFENSMFVKPEAYAALCRAVIERGELMSALANARPSTREYLDAIEAIRTAALRGKEGT